MPVVGSNPPGAGDSEGFGFLDEDTFLADLRVLENSVSRDALDDHLRASEDQLAPDPIPWSGFLPENPAIRVAVTDSTDHNPNALRITFRVEGTNIIRMGVELRGFPPQEET